MRANFKARAKINLTLDVVGRRRDGYHFVEMIMHQIELSDHICVVVNEKPGGIDIECNHPSVPRNGENIACRAARLVKERFNIGHGVTIHIDKGIPVAAGLAGGSSDAAAVIKALNRLWHLGMSERAMMDMGAELGADVPFCIMGGTALAEGIGEMLTPVDTGTVLDLLLVKPDVMVSTAWAYKNLDPGSIKRRPDNAGMVNALKNGDIKKIASGLVNVLENVTIPSYPEIEQIKRNMLDAGALGSAMSGSGPAVFGIFNDSTGAEQASKIFRGAYRNVVVTKTYIPAG